MTEKTKQTSRAIFDIPVVAETSIAPDPGGVSRAFARIGYKIEEALADLVDNSIDAKAKTVLIRFYRGKDALERVTVVDDGSGLTRDRLDVAMQFGGESSHSSTDLGKFGMGLKSASLSQCRSFSLLTRTGQGVSGRRWTAESIERNWMCETLDEINVGEFLGGDWDPVDLTKNGTIVIWDDLEHLQTSNQDIERLITKLFRQISHHLGLVFHRFLAKDKIQIFVDSLNFDNEQLGPRERIAPLDPFGYHRSGMIGYPKDYSISLDGLKPLVFQAHIWPGQSAELGYRLGGGKVASRQGFYFYRNDRIIQAGGWSGIRDNDSEPHTSLARVKVNLPSEFDNEFRVSVQKSKIDVPPALRLELGLAKSNNKSFAQYIQDANDVYRGTIEIPDPPIIAGTGIPSSVRKEIRRSFATKENVVRPVKIAWIRMNRNLMFQIDRDQNVLKLNSRYRAQLAGSSDKGVVVNSLIFLLLRDEFNRKAVRSSHTDAIANLNKILISAIESNSG